MIATRPARVLAAALVPALAAAAPASPARKIKVAVMEIRPLGTEVHKAELLSEVAITEASGIAGLDIIGRSDITSMVGFEKQKQILGCTEDSACLAEIGGALGVDAVLFGSLGRLGNLYRVDLKVVDTRKARVLGRFGESVEGREETLVAAVARGVKQLLSPLVGGELTPPMAAGKALERVPVPPAPPASTSTPTSTPTPTATPTATTTGTVFTRSTWGWTLAGAGGALVAGGVVMGLQAQKAYQDEKKASQNNDLAAYDSARKKAKSNAMVADVLYGLGAGSAGVGIYLVLTGRQAALAAVPAQGGAAVVVAGRF